MASNKQQRCHYDVLGLSRDCSADEIRTAYKKLALHRHPDKLVQSGLSQADATAQFQELVHAYEVLSDPKERAWYDSHRSHILFSDPNSANSVPGSVIPNLFPFFSTTVYSGYADTARGFYNVYSDVFNKIYANEVNFCRKLGLGLDIVREAPLMGNSESDYSQVSAFYNYWLGFCTVMDFCWVDQYDVMAGPNRKSRRVMEEENRKLRKKARREYNETVRGLAEFVKKRDKRVIDMIVKKNVEMEKMKEEEKERKKKLERERMERLRAYEDPEWAKVNEEEVDGIEVFEDEDEDERGKKGNGGKEFYCVLCGKKFKSEKQWKNHEQSKKHKDKVAELRESFQNEDDVMEDIEKDEQEMNEDVDYIVEEMEERFKENLRIRQEGNQDNAEALDSSDKKDGFFDADDMNGIDEKNENVEEEMSILEAMLWGHKSRKSRGVNEGFPPSEDAKEEIQFMEYDNRKSRKKRGKKGRGQNNGGERVKSDIDGSNSPNEEQNGHDNKQKESCSHSFVESENDVHLGNNITSLNQSTYKKGAARKEANVKSKNSSKGKKVKATSKGSGNECETCGVEFESRNKLHKHLGDTGHSTLKFR